MNNYVKYWNIVILHTIFCTTDQINCKKNKEKNCAHSEQKINPEKVVKTEFMHYIRIYMRQ